MVGVVGAPVAGRITMAPHQQAADAPRSLDRTTEVVPSRLLDLRGVRRVALVEDQRVGMVGDHGAFKGRGLPTFALEVVLVRGTSRNGSSGSFDDRRRAAAVAFAHQT